jgi:hypothetical protein
VRRHDRRGGEAAPSLKGNAAAAYQHQYYSDIFDAQIDILSRAVVCGMTRVATLQAGSADGNVTDPVGPGYPHHNTSTAARRSSPCARTGTPPSSCAC